MKRLIMQKYSGDGDYQNPTTFPQIARDKFARIFTRQATKTYKVVFDKRVICENGNTLPFGYS
jgi:hypothetical protein